MGDIWMVEENGGCIIVESTLGVVHVHLKDDRLQIIIGKKTLWLCGLVAKKYNVILYL